MAKMGKVVLIILAVALGLFFLFRLLSAYPWGHRVIYPSYRIGIEDSDVVVYIRNAENFKEIGAVYLIFPNKTQYMKFGPHRDGSQELVDVDGELKIESNFELIDIACTATFGENDDQRHKLLLKRESENNAKLIITDASSVIEANKDKDSMVILLEHPTRGLQELGVGPYDFGRLRDGAVVDPE